MYKSVKKLSLVNAAYIAGLIDGEGTVTLTRRHKDAYRCLAVTISNTDYNLLVAVRSLVGAGSITTKRTYNVGHSPGYTYQTFNRQALALLQQTSRYLKTYKRTRARLVLKYYVKYTPRNGKYSQKVLDQRGKFIRSFFEVIPYTTQAA